MIKRTLLILLAMAIVASSTNAAPKRLTVQHKKLFAIVTAYLEESVNDARRLDIVAWYVPVLPLKPAYRWTGGYGQPEVKRSGYVGYLGWRAINRTGWAVCCKYRGSNGFGAVMIETKVFFVSGGRVIRHCEKADFSPIRPRRRQDPHTQQFLNLLPRALRQL